MLASPMNKLETSKIGNKWLTKQPFSYTEQTQNSVIVTIRNPEHDTHKISSKGITAFIMDKDTKGFSIAKKERKLGIKASSTCVVNFDDVEIPHSALLGKEGEGYKYAIL